MRADFTPTPVPTTLQDQKADFAAVFGYPDASVFWEEARPSNAYPLDFFANHRRLDQRGVDGQVYYLWLRLTDLSPTPAPPVPSPAAAAPPTPAPPVPPPAAAAPPTPAPPVPPPAA